MDPGVDIVVVVFSGVLTGESASCLTPPHAPAISGEVGGGWSALAAPAPLEFPAAAGAAPPAAPSRSVPWGRRYPEIQSIPPQVATLTICRYAAFRFPLHLSIYFIYCSLISFFFYECSFFCTLNFSTDNSFVCVMKHKSSRLELSYSIDQCVCPFDWTVYM